MADVKGSAKFATNAVTSVATTAVLAFIGDPDGTPADELITKANLQTGDDAKLVSGTAGTSGNLASWNADGDLVDAGAASSAFAAASHTHAASDIASGTLADARISESSVTQHEAALGITESQITDFGTYALATHTHAASDITSGTLADARVAESNVTQHEAALTITESQISDLGAYLTAITGEDIGDLADVTITSPASGHILSWDGAAWVNGAPAAAGGDFESDGSVAMTGALDLGTVGQVTSNVADGASAVAFDHNTANEIATSGGLLQRWRNNGVTKASIDKDGVIEAAGGNFSINSFGEITNVKGSATATFGASNAGLAGFHMLYGSDRWVVSNVDGHARYNVISNNAFSFGNGFATEATTKVIGFAAVSDFDIAQQDLEFRGATALASATTNITGGDVSLLGGGGAASSAGAAHGGDVHIAGGTGYGTGDDGNIIVTVPTSDPAVSGALWSDSGTLKISAG